MCITCISCRLCGASIEQALPGPGLEICQDVCPKDSCSPRSDGSACHTSSCRRPTLCIIIISAEVMCAATLSQIPVGREVICCPHEQAASKLSTSSTWAWTVNRMWSRFSRIWHVNLRLFALSNLCREQHSRDIQPSNSLQQLITYKIIGKSWFGHQSNSDHG